LGRGVRKHHTQIPHFFFARSLFSPLTHPPTAGVSGICFWRPRGRELLACLCWRSGRAAEPANPAPGVRRKGARPCPFRRKGNTNRQ
jgi:hypothetical protein